LLKAALRLIEDELNDPEFGVHQIANALNVSARYVQLLFSDLAITPTQYLLQRRLEVAADQLCRGSSTRIGELALSVGFNDMAYFSRAFRKHFGSSARTFRLHNCQRINRSAEFV
jgi:AraC-like DNA-binding protein